MNTTPAIATAMPASVAPPISLIVVAGLLEASVTVLFYLCIVAIGPVLTMLIMATTPVFSIVLGVVFLRERPGLRLTIAAAVTVAGVLIATLDGLARRRLPPRQTRVTSPCRTTSVARPPS